MNTFTEYTKLIQTANELIFNNLSISTMYHKLTTAIANIQISFSMSTSLTSLKCNLSLPQPNMDSVLASACIS